MDGVLTVAVYPVYVGVATGHPGEGPVAENEPYDHFDYTRGQIWWRQNDEGQTVGSATVFVPAGVYTHVVWFRGPHREALQSCEQMEHPLVFNRSGQFRVDPILIQS